MGNERKKSRTKSSKQIVKMKKDMNLMSMTDFVSQHVETGCAIKQISKIRNYSNFLKQPLILGIFIPCDLNGNVLKEPKQTSLTCSFHQQQMFFNKEKIYEQAKERVLFEGFRVNFNAIISPCGGYLDESKFKHKTIESLVGSKLILTKSAKKQIEL